MKLLGKRKKKGDVAGGVNSQHGKSQSDVKKGGDAYVRRLRTDDKRSAAAAESRGTTTGYSAGVKQVSQDRHKSGENMRGAAANNAELSNIITTNTASGPLRSPSNKVKRIAKRINQAGSNKRQMKYGNRE